MVAFMRMPRSNLSRAASRLLNLRTGWRKGLEPHKEALRVLRDGGKMRDCCKAHGVSRQTIWRMLKKGAWPKKPGGPRKGRWKIPPELLPKVVTRMRLFRQDGKPIGLSTADWLRKNHQIVVTPATIYSLRYRAKVRRQMRRAAAKPEAKDRI